MFTGIIEELARVKMLQRRGRFLRLQLKAKKVNLDAKIGQSIAVNGVCLTLVAKENNLIGFDVLSETADKSNIGKLKIAELVNLERALKVGDRLSGHFVNGHVDCIGIIRKKSYKGNNLCYEISFPSKFLNNLVEKGSIAVDGISLTICQIRANTFTVNIIPHTLDNTTLKFKGPSSKVNLEFDVLLKRNSNDITA